MKDTATSVNAALDAAVPNGYPETLYESMRCVGVGVGVLHLLRVA
jgi:hypothetical protein